MIVETEDKTFVRDTTTMALFPKRELLEEFRRHRRKDQEIEALSKKVNMLETKLDTILSLLSEKSK